MSKVHKAIKIVVGLLCLLVMVSQVGCSAKKTYGAIEVITDPPGAEVINTRDNAHLGTTPCKVVWEGEDGTPQQVTIQMRKKGYKEEISTVWVNTRHETREAAEATAQPVNAELSKRK
jgi:hypothetical protein